MSADNQPATQTEEGMDTDSDNHNSVATEGSENITVSSRAINPGEWTISCIETSDMPLNTFSIGL